MTTGEQPVNDQGAENAFLSMTGALARMEVRRANPYYLGEAGFPEMGTGLGRGRDLYPGEAPALVYQEWFACLAEACKRNGVAFPDKAATYAFYLNLCKLRGQWTGQKVAREIRGAIDPTSPLGKRLGLLKHRIDTGRMNEDLPEHEWRGKD